MMMMQKHTLETQSHPSKVVSSSFSSNGIWDEGHLCCSGEAWGNLKSSPPTPVALCQVIRSISHCDLVYSLCCTLRAPALRLLPSQCHVEIPRHLSRGR